MNGPAPGTSPLQAFLAALRRTPAETVRRFLGETIWHWDLAALPLHQRLAVQAGRMLYLIGRAFVSSRAQLQAMALTYTTMLALVPAFAIIVAMFSLRGLQEARGRLETFVFELLAASPEQERILSQQLTAMTENVAQSGGVAGFAFFVFLFLTVVALLHTLEQTLNQIWGVQRSRSWINKFLTYWGIATLGPFLLGSALVQGSALESELYDVGAWWGNHQPVATASPSPTPTPADGLDEFGFGGVGGALVAELEQERARRTDPVDLEYILTGTRRPPRDGHFSLLAFGLTVTTFFLLYAFMPNTRVRLRPAVIGALTAAGLWSATKWALAASSASLVKYDTLYGSLATIPITMFWLYLTWLIVILGAELTFALQNVHSQRREELATNATWLCKEIVALRLCAGIAHAFDGGREPPSAEDLAGSTGAPHALCAALLFHLSQDGLLRELERSDGERGYVPARPLERISLADVVESLRERAGVAFDLAWGADLPVLSEHLGRANQAFKSLAATTSLREVVRNLERRLREGAAAPDPVLAAAGAVTARAIASAALQSPPTSLRRSGRVEPPPTDAAAPAAEEASPAPESTALEPRSEEAPAPAATGPGGPA